MIRPPMMSSIFEKCTSTAQTGNFWRASTHGNNEVPSINLAIKITDLGAGEYVPPSCFDGLRFFRGKVVDPALPEVEFTPPHVCHVITDQDVLVAYPSDMTPLTDTIARAMCQNHLLRMIDVRVYTSNGKLIAEMDKNVSGLTAWQPKFNDHALNVAELFCGGFAGWNQAIRFLSGLGVPIKTMLAVDECPNATRMYAKNYDAAEVSMLCDPRKQPCDGIKDVTLVLQHPVQKPVWYHLGYQREIQVWCMSPPCQLGFFKEDGQTTLEAIGSARLQQPFLILLENVVGMGEDENLQVIHAMFRWAGFELVHHETNDLKDIAPTARARWVSIWVRKDLAPRMIGVQATWFKAREHSISSFGIDKLEIPNDILETFMLTEELQTIYGDKRYLPENMRPTGKMDPHADLVLRRCVKPHGRFATFVASYGSQHELPNDLLESKGLFAQLIEGNEGIRFITPFEQILAFAASMPFYIPTYIPEAYRTIGHAISPPQALYGILKALQAAQIPKCSQSDAMFTVLDFLSKRPRAEQVAVCEDMQWYIMHLKHENMNGEANVGTTMKVKMPVLVEELGLTNDPKRKGENEHEGSEKGHEPTKRHKVDDDHEQPIEISPTQPFDVIEPGKEMVHEYASVTVIMPADAFTGRFRIPTTPREILLSQGYDASEMMIRFPQTQRNEMDTVLTDDATLVVFSDCSHHIDQAAVRFQEKHAVATKPRDVTKGINLTIKSLVGQHNQVFWKGIVQHDISLQWIDTQVRESLIRMGIRVPLRWTCKHMALSPDWGWTLNMLTGAGQVTLCFHFPIVGGGPSGERLDESIKTQLTAELVALGVGFSRLVPIVAMIASKFNATQIKQKISHGDPTERANLIYDMANQAGCAIDKKGAREKAAKKIQKAVRTTKPWLNKEIDLKSLKIAEGTFVNGDQTKTQITVGTFEPNGHGLYLTKLADVQKWLDGANMISSDELAVLVLGHVQTDTPREHKHIQFRVFQEGNGMLLLKGTLFQLGTKSVYLHEGKVTTIQCPNTSVVTMTTYADDFPPAVWDDVKRSPAKHMLSLFDFDLRKKAILGIWGHSYQANGKPAKSEDADSIQFHARVLTEHLQAMLQQSGWNHVYMVPKQDKSGESSGPDNQYAVVWTGRPMQETLILAKEIQASLGIARNKTSFGIRVNYDVYADSFRKINPGRDVPTMIKVQQLYRAQNMPHNITIPEVRQWLAGISWDAKPLKKISHSVWLIGAAKAPEHSTCALNQNVILITEQNRKPDLPNPVLAGKPMFSVPQSQPSMQEPLKGDPWANWKPANPASTATPAPRTIDAPTTSKFAEQDTKIEGLNRKFEELEKLVKGETESMSTQIKGAAQQQQEQFAKLTEEVDQRLQRQAKENESKFASLHGAIDAGNKNSEEQFKMLREMLAGTLAARKTPRTDGTITPGGKDDASMANGN